MGATSRTWVYRHGVNSGRKLKLVDEIVEKTTAEPERMVPQSEVDKLVVGVKREAAEKARREAEAEFSRQSNGNPHAQGIGGMPAIDVSKIKEEVLDGLRSELEEKQRAAEEGERRRRASEFVATYESKLAEGKGRYDDFDEVVSQIDPKEFVDVILLAGQAEGTADIMYELARNPDKLARVASMAQRSQKQAQRMMAEIATSVKQNREAVDNHQTTKQPLPKLTPSTAGTSTSELKTVNDFKKASWLRG